MVIYFNFNFHQDSNSLTFVSISFTAQITNHASCKKAYNGGNLGELSILWLVVEDLTLALLVFALTLVDLCTSFWIVFPLPYSSPREDFFERSAFHSLHFIMFNEFTISRDLSSSHRFCHRSSPLPVQLLKPKSPLYFTSPIDHGSSPNTCHQIVNWQLDLSIKSISLVVLPDLMYGSRAIPTPK